MHDAACGHKEESLKESVSHQMENTRSKGTYAASHEHVAELADGGVSEHSFYVKLGNTNSSRIECRCPSDYCHTVKDIGASANRTLQRATMYTPAVTIVAAWINALTESDLPWRPGATCTAVSERIFPLHPQTAAE